MKLTEELVLHKHEKLINPDTTLQNNLMAFGLSCGKGWYGIIDNALSKMEELGLPEDFEIFQIKEKYGELRIYTSGNVSEEAYDKLRRIIDEAEMLSSITCEVCGVKDAKKQRVHGWISTLCDKCRDSSSDEEM